MKIARPPLYLAALLAFVVVAKGQNPTDAELEAITDELSTLDTFDASRLTVDLSRIGGIVYTTTAPLLSGPVTLLDGPIIDALRQLYVEYHHPTDVPEIRNLGKINKFLDEIMKTKVMKKAKSFLVRKGFIRSNFKVTLRAMWFGLYSRVAGVKIASSCGFEHVFMGETKKDSLTSTKSSVIGFHNWIFYYNEQQADRMPKYRYDGDNVELGNNKRKTKLKTYWQNFKIKQGTFLLGTSPELEFALYTICFLTRANAPGGNALCPVKIHGTKLNVLTTYIGDAWKLPGYEYTNARDVIGSAHPAS